MKKNYTRLLTGLLFVLGTVCANAQVTVTNPANTTPGLAATYASLAAAITDLNLQTAISGSVTITLDPANPQTSPAGGYAITTTLTGASAVNTVTIAGSSNTITAPVTHTIGALNDAIFKIIGSDFITISGFTMNENAANIVTTAATNTMTEWGVALLYASTTNGAQNITIQNNTIALNRTYQNTFGIYSNSTHTATAVTTSASATTTAGGNSGLKIYTNNISNVNLGIVVVGPTAAADMNNGVDIGGTAAGTGNTLSNYGTTGTFSGYANVSGTVYGILVRNSTTVNISYNSITSSTGAAGVTAGTLRGIYIPSASIQPTGTFTNSINNNTLAITSHVLAGTLQGITVESTTSSPTSTTNINTNNFTTLNHTIAAASGAITAISQSGTATAGPLVTSVSFNTFTSITSSSTGSFTFISNSFTMPASATKNVNNNSVVTAFSKTGAGGTVTFFTDNGSDVLTTTANTNNNIFSNITVTGATAVTGILNTDGGAPIKNVMGNTVSNITGGTGAIIGISTGFDGGPTTITGNNINSITSGGAITAMTHASGVGVRTIGKNKIYDLNGTAAGSVIIGMAIPARRLRAQLHSSTTWLAI